VTPIEEINELLAEQGEPATCREELERYSIHVPEPEAPAPWSWEAIQGQYALLDFDLARDIARGK
jgi:hypothetical protein